MKILIIGASGLVGSHVLAEAAARGHIVLGTYRSQPLPGLEPLDLADPDRAAALLDRFRPDWVVHAAGWTWVDGCEKDPARAFRENCEQPARLAEFAEERGARFAYFSTTYIFDGTRGPYGEGDTPNPINVYARSKWEAELRIQKIMAGAALIPRVICVWGREVQRKNFVYQALDALGAGREMRLPRDQKGNPTWAGDIAWWLLSLCESGFDGVWNLASDRADCGRVEWFEIIRARSRQLRLVPDPAPGCMALATEALNQPARRPLDASAGVDKIRKAFPAYRSSGPECLERMLG